MAGRSTKAAATTATTGSVTAPKKEEKTFPTSAKLIEDGFTTKSARIRELHRLGMATGAIAKQECGGLYQHAYNVIKKPLKRPTDDVQASAEAAKEQA